MFKPLLLAALCCTPAAATAAVHCVTNASQLLAALDAAGDNGEPDEIRLARGTYYGTAAAPFVLTVSEPHGVLLTGGWSVVSSPGSTTAACVLRSWDASRTVLDGSSAVNALWITVAIDHHIVPLHVEGLTFRNGRSTIAGSHFGSALTVHASLEKAPALVVDNVIAHSNISTHTSTPIVGLSSAEHSVRFSNSVVRDNTTTNAPAVFLYGHNGSIAANGLTVVRNSRSGSGGAVEFAGATGLLNASLVWGNPGGSADLVENPRMRLRDVRYGSFSGTLDSAWHTNTLAIADPLLQSITVPRPLATSPLRNAASSFSGVGLYDVFGATRTQGGAQDIGAAEFLE
jgi:hypothetical protein